MNCKKIFSCLFVAYAAIYCHYTARAEVVPDYNFKAHIFGNDISLHDNLKDYRISVGLSDSDPNLLIVCNKGFGDYFNIQDAVDASNDGATIIVNPGIYTGPSNREISFSGKAITIMSVDPYDRWTIANTVVDCEQAGRGFVFESGEGYGSILFGLTVINGYADGSYEGSPGAGGYGGAIYCYYSSPTIANCILQNNIAVSGAILGSGGAISCYNSSPAILNCTIIGNTAYYGGGISCRFKSVPVIHNCTIYNNISQNDGGGIYCWVNSQPYIKNTLIASNQAGARGGGIFYFECGHSDPNAPGGEFVNGVENCTIANNAAQTTGGGIFCMDSTVRINNSIIWGNLILPIGNDPAEQQIHLIDDSLRETTMEISYSNLMGGKESILVGVNAFLTYETGNLNADPLFADPSEGNFYLMSSAGRWCPDLQNWKLDDGGNFLQEDDMNSPCIDAGDPDSEFILEPDCNGERINMGAYGNTPFASRSYSEICCMELIPGDLNGDCRVDLADFRIIANNWLECSILPRFYCDIVF